MRAGRLIVVRHSAPACQDRVEWTLRVLDTGATARKIPSARCPRSCGGFEHHALALKEFGSRDA
jgi:hypothetical protein